MIPIKKIDRKKLSDQMYEIGSTGNPIPDHQLIFMLAQVHNVILTKLDEVIDKLNTLEHI